MSEADDKLPFFTPELEEMAAALSKEHLTFANHYIANGNATQAYLHAYGDSMEYRSAVVAGSKLLTHPKVGPYVREARRLIAKSKLMSLDEIASRIQAQAFADVTQFIGWEPRPMVNDDGEVIGEMTVPVVKMSSDEVPEEIRGLIKGITFTKMGPKFEMADQQKAQDMLIKMLGGYKETVNHISSDGSMSPQGSDVTEALRRKYGSRD